MGRIVLVTGVSGDLGGRFARLERNPRGRQTERRFARLQPVDVPGSRAGIDGEQPLGVQFA